MLSRANNIDKERLIQYIKKTQPTPRNARTDRLRQPKPLPKVTKNAPTGYNSKNNPQMGSYIRIPTQTTSV
jgi:hypothetical protein